MANLITKNLAFVPEDGWVKIGVAGRRDILLDLYNESGFALRLYMGAEIAFDDVVASVPFGVGANNYYEGNNTNEVYVSSTETAGTAIAINYVEG